MPRSPRRVRDATARQAGDQPSASVPPWRLAGLGAFRASATTFSRTLIYSRKPPTAFVGDMAIRLRPVPVKAFADLDQAGFVET